MFERVQSSNMATVCFVKSILKSELATGNANENNSKREIRNRSKQCKMTRVKAINANTLNFIMSIWLGLGWYFVLSAIGLERWAECLWLISIEIAMHGVNTIDFTVCAFFSSQLESSRCIFWPGWKISFTLSLARMAISV